MEQPMEPLPEVIDKSSGFEPDFMSCTCGVGGSNKGRSSEIRAAIAGAGRTIPVARFTCVGNTAEDVKKLVAEYMSFGVSHFLALRGDFPEGWTGTGGDFAHGDELVAYIRRLYPDLCIAAGCYPEKHLVADSLEEDIALPRSKQDAGADFLMTQLCHGIINTSGIRRNI